MNTQSPQEKSGIDTIRPWPHRLAWMLACGVFPLIWMGGLVTTYEAGMSVPDWPTTYGSWFYPIQQWLWKFNDLFLEHSHRTIAQIVGIIAILLIVSVWRNRQRKSVRWLALVILAGVILQGVLGGLRVVLDERILARIHGCAAPLVFALCTSMATITSPTWRSRNNSLEYPSAHIVQWLVLAISGGLYLEIVLGAQIRHPLPQTLPFLFPFLVWVKIIIAGLLLAAMLYLLVQIIGKLREEKVLIRRAVILAALYFVQLLLAGGAWITNFGWPKWFTGHFVTMDYTVEQVSRLQIWLTTAHAAVGSLNFVAALSLTMWSYHLLRGPSQ
jgi:heme a synthase